MSSVRGIPLEKFEEPIQVALNEYSFVTGGEVEFEIEAASKLELRPDKSYTASSTTTVLHRGEVAGKLAVLAFDHEDGTGNQDDYKLVDSMSGYFYPLFPQVVPRRKTNLHSEAHLTLASVFGGRDRDPTLFAGHMKLVSFRRLEHEPDVDKISPLAVLGQDLHDFYAAFRGHGARPTVTYTVGFKENGERFGDPHSVYNAQLAAQVCGFIAVTNEMAAQHSSMLEKLGAVFPERGY